MIRKQIHHTARGFIRQKKANVYVLQRTGEGFLDRIAGLVYDIIMSEVGASE